MFLPNTSVFLVTFAATYEGPIERRVLDKFEEQCLRKRLDRIALFEADRMRYPSLAVTVDELRLNFPRWVSRWSLVRATPHEDDAVENGKSTRRFFLEFSASARKTNYAPSIRTGAPYPSR